MAGSFCRSEPAAELRGLAKMVSPAAFFARPVILSMMLASVGTEGNGHWLEEMDLALGPAQAEVFQVLVDMLRQEEK